MIYIQLNNVFLRLTVVTAVVAVVAVVVVTAATAASALISLSRTHGRPNHCRIRKTPK